MNRWGVMRQLAWPVQTPSICVHRQGSIGYDTDACSKMVQLEPFLHVCFAKVGLSRVSDMEIIEQ